MFSDDDEDRIDEDFVEGLLAGIASGSAQYADVDDIRDCYQYLLSVSRADDAERLLRWGLSIHVEDVSLLMLRATALIDQDELDKAESLLDYVADAAQNCSTYFINRGWLLIKRDREHEALPFFDKAIDVAGQEDKWVTVSEIATNLNQMEFFDDAMMYYDRLPKSEIMDNPQVAFEYAYALEKVGRDDEAIRTYENVVKLDSFNERAWYNLGILYGKKERLDDSIAAYVTSTDIEPLYAEPYFNMGNIFLTQGKYQDAIHSYTEYISLADSPEEYVYQNIGECWMELGGYDYALRFFEVTVRNMPDSASGWYCFGRCCVEIGNPAAAMSAFNKAIALEPDNANYYFANAQALFNLNQTDMTIEMLEKGVSLSPDDVLAWFEIVRMRLIKLGPKANEIRIYIAEMKEKYDTPAALQLVEAYIEFFIFGKKREASLLLRGVADKTPDILKDASEEPTLSKLFEKKEILKILKEYNIKL